MLICLRKAVRQHRVSGPRINKGLHLVEVAPQCVADLNLYCKRSHARPLVPLVRLNILASMGSVGQTPA